MNYWSANEYLVDGNNTSLENNKHTKIFVRRNNNHSIDLVYGDLPIIRWELSGEQTFWFNGNKSVALWALLNKYADGVYFMKTHENEVGQKTRLDMTIVVNKCQTEFDFVDGVTIE